jgi:hypothetical protein
MSPAVASTAIGADIEAGRVTPQQGNPKSLTLLITLAGRGGSGSSQFGTFVEP